jgi:hypothetical protein
MFSKLRIKKLKVKNNLSYPPISKGGIHPDGVSPLRGTLGGAVFNFLFQ